MSKRFLDTIDSPKKRKYHHEHDIMLNVQLEEILNDKIKIIEDFYQTKLHQLHATINSLQLKIDVLEKEKLVSTTDNNTVQCVICFDDCTSPAIVIPCGHLFCNSCVEHWFTTSSICPTCRGTVERYQKIFV